MTLNHNLKVMLDQQLEDICKANHIPGMALNVYKAGEPYYEKYYGHRDVAKELPVTDQTIFPAASVTKSFTTLSVMILVDQGKLSVDDRVTDWLPELTLPDQ